MHRDSHGQRELWREGDTVVWSSVAGAAGGAEDGAGHGVGQPAALYVAVFNTGEAARDIRLPLSALGVPAGVLGVTDLWDGLPVATLDDSLTLAVPAHGCRLVRFDSVG